MIDPRTLSEKTGIQLEPADWFRATWRDLTPLPRPTPKPFDADRITELYTKLSGGKNRAANYWNWNRGELPLTMTPQEAHFWLYAMTRRHNSDPFQADDLRFVEPPSWEQAAEYLENFSGWHTLQVVIPLFNLFPVSQIIEWLLSISIYSGNAVVDGFIQYIVPLLEKDERDQLKAQVQAVYSHHTWPAGWYSPAPPAFLLAAGLGLHQEIEQLVNSWKDDQFKMRGRQRYVPYNRPHDMIFGLDSPGKVVHHMERLDLHFITPENIKAWFAHTKTQHIEMIEKSIQFEQAKNRRKILVKTLGLARSPQVAAIMMTLMHENNASSIARDWLNDNIEIAVEGLLPLADQNSNLGRSTRHYLQGLARSEHRTIIESQAEERLQNKIFDSTVDNDYTEFTDSTTPVWLKDGIRAVQESDNAGEVRWIAPHELPPIVVGDYILNEKQVQFVLQALKASTPDATQPLVKSIKRYASPFFLDKFVWQLLEIWTHKERTRDNWAVLAIGFLGSDTLAVDLNLRLRQWWKKRQRKWVATGLEALRIMGTDTALLQIFHLKRQLTSKKAREAIQEVLDEIMKARELTEDELSDRMVPDCGLDSNGSRIFDYGPRQFRLVMGDDLKPILRDSKNKLLKTLPRPNKKDDEDKVKQARADWQLIKKQIRDAVKVQTRRLEMAMIAGRRWTEAKFRQYFMDHPLMQHFTRLLIWGNYTESGELIHVFRIRDDRFFINQMDETIEYVPIQQIGIVHPMHLQEEHRVEWAELLRDYEIIQPFSQIGREVYTLPDKKMRDTAVTTVGNSELHVLSIIGDFSKKGWRKESRYSDEYIKRFGLNPLHAVCKIKRVNTASGQYQFDRFYFRTDDDKPDEKTLPPPLKLEDVPAVFISEVIRDLIQIFT